MPRTPKTPAEKLAPIADEILDQFGPATGMSMADIDAATRRLKRSLMERMLGGELTHHVGYPAGGDKRADATNCRNGTSAKTVLTDDGPVALAVPRDRAGTFPPVLVPKHARRMAGFDDKVVALDARGLSTREIQQFPGRDLRHRRLTGFDQRGHGRGRRRCDRLASAAARAHVSGRVLWRVAREDPR